MKSFISILHSFISFYLSCGKTVCQPFRKCQALIHKVKGVFFIDPFTLELSLSLSSIYPSMGTIVPGVLLRSHTLKGCSCVLKMSQLSKCKEIGARSEHCVLYVCVVSYMKDLDPWWMPLSSFHSTSKLFLQIL